MICPICLKAGLQNDTAICPQCNSDLSAFILIQNIQKDKSRNKNNFKWALTIVGLCILFALIYWQFPRTVTEIVEAKTQTKIDSTDYFKSELAKLKETQASDTNKIVKYIVKQNDNLGKISKQLFNDYKHVDRIVKENKIQNQNMIVVGEILFIDLSENK